MDRRKPSSCSRFILLLRNLFIAALAYTFVVEVLHIYQTGTISPFSKGSPKKSTGRDSKGGSLSGGVNWRLRPTTLVEGTNDAFMGRRPDVDTYANYTKLIETCRGSLNGLERMRNVYDCLDYLTRREDDYFFMAENRPSAADPNYKSIEGAAPPSTHYIGDCPGPVQLYHTYWTGPATWRVELFVKAYLYTQNIPCSRLYIWLESDGFPDAVSDMMKDPLFAKFLPLVERGDLVLKAWKFPRRIPLPKGAIAEDPAYTKSLAGKGSLRGTSGEARSPKTEVYIADGVVRMEDGSEWLVLTERQMTFLPVAVSDAVRFIVLHLHGGVYMDMDVMLLRDMRPLLLTPDHNFAERWAVHSHPGDYNTAVMSLNANSSLSSYLVRGGIRMGLNFHPRIIGRMAWKDGRNEEFAMFETGLFDPIWGEFNWGREGRCTVPCFKDYGVAFQGTRGAIKDEWESYDGKPLSERVYQRELELRSRVSDSPPSSADEIERASVEALAMEKGDADVTYGGKPYTLKEDKYPPNNRTLENFFRGAWSYHIHNQWTKHPQPNSWFDIAQKAHDGFLQGTRKNVYGESWTGPDIPAYDRWPEFD
ncbi:unnamed protein product [Tuber melanosporum]|uniref:(Perigord truffle) hypothetical protein n=1 Tax=Tuber melanosporum (strain Mel28) TaxID=656061 RepID=D5G4V4_TUBMM|nr:uncharacterized protein GSTUM_00000106001 [Tuber melanosporum]CAZ79547.1 unnamed protein product [Tuber melanosporum]